MNHLPEGLASLKQTFYKQYADANEIDYYQLVLLDLMDQAGGHVTRLMLEKTMECSRSRLYRTLQELEQEGLLEIGADIVSLSLSAPFVIGDVLFDLRNEYECFLSEIPEREKTEPLLKA